MPNPLIVDERPHPFGEQGVRSSLEAVANKVAAGGKHPKVRAWALEQLERYRRETGKKVNNARERAEALLGAVQRKLWVPDNFGVEFVTGAHLTACDRSTTEEICFLSGDCFPEGTYVLAFDHRLVTVETLRPGDMIWGHDRWTKVEAVSFKGALPVDVIFLNNGSEVELTADHHVYVLDCKLHSMLDDGEDPKVLALFRDEDAENERDPCSCPAEKRIEKRVRMSELRAGMMMIRPNRIPFGTEEMDPDRAYVEGLFVADGWAENYRFAISGQDGCPKEEQKREVQGICNRLGVATRWHRKYLAVNDSEWSLRMQQMGERAREKHLLSINLSEGIAGPTLRGVMADSGANTYGKGRTFTTTSRLLALQTRVLHKMFGISCGSRFIANHGGLGSNPIYRLGTRPSGGWPLRVKEIARSVFEAPCWDIQTEDHRVYLPEQDVTVSQCDDLTVLLGSCFLSVGLPTLIVGHGFSDGRISHVLTAVQLAGKWERADPSVQLPLGQSVPFSRERILEPFNASTLCDKATCLDELKGLNLENYVRQGTFVGVDAPPQRRIRWLGQDQPSVGQTTKQAAETELAKHTQDGSLSRDDAKAVGSVTGAAAAGAACAAVGVPVASPLCAAVGAEIGEFVGAALADAYAAVGTPGSAAPWFELQVVRVYRLHNALFPNDPPWHVDQAISAMVAEGMDQRCADRTGRYLRSSFCQMNATEPIVRRIQAKQIAAAADRRARERIGGSKKSSLTVPIVIGAIVGGLWWLLA